MLCVHNYVIKIKALGMDWSKVLSMLYWALSIVSTKIVAITGWWPCRTDKLYWSVDGIAQMVCPGIYRWMAQANPINHGSDALSCTGNKYLCCFKKLWNTQFSLIGLYDILYKPHLALLYRFCSSAVCATVLALLQNSCTKLLLLHKHKDNVSEHFIHGCIIISINIVTLRDD